MSWLWFWLWLGCGPGGGAGGEVPSDCRTQTRLVAATTDYQVGALATVDLDTLQLRDELASASGDPVVVVDECEVFQLNRTGGFVRRYAAGEFAAPMVEFATPAANPHDVARVGDELWVTRFEEAALGVYDLDGSWLADVDLSQHADPDGLPEADALVEWDGRLFAALQRLDRDQDWTSPGGVVVEVDPVARQLVSSWATEANPRLVAGADALYLLTGHFTAPDNALWRLHPDAAEPELLLDAGDVVFADLAVGEPASVLLTASLDSAYSAWCLDLADPEPVLGLATEQFLADVAIDHTGRAWLAVAAGWPPTGEPTGLLPFDPVACQPLAAIPIATSLDPHSVDLY